jgi:hypothetical protein
VSTGARKPTFYEARDAYLAEYYRLLGAIARGLRLRSLADAFALLADVVSLPGAMSQQGQDPEPRRRCKAGDRGGCTQPRRARH